MSLLDRLLRRDDPAALPRSVRPDRARELLADGALLVDVRESREWRAGHVRGARHIPLDRLATEARRLPADVPVVVMCASGTRSRAGAAQLRGTGRQATSLAGGLAAWQATGGSVTR